MTSITSLNGATPDVADEPGPPLLRVADLSLSAGRGPTALPLVREVSLEVTAGRVVGIVGETGSGKSMTIRGILGLLPSGVHRTAGEVEIAGTSMTGASERRRRAIRGRDVGLIPQDPWSALDPLLTVGDHFRHALRANTDHLDRAAIDALGRRVLGQCGIPEPDRVIASHPHQLSGGMAQRAVIAVVLACSPRLILADEVTTSLDVTVQREVLDLLATQARSEGRGILLVSHDPGVVANYCDRVIVMYGGRIVEDGPARSIFGDPKHPYTQELVASMRGGTVDIDTVESGPPPQHVRVGCAFAPRCPRRTDECEQIVPPSASVDHERSVACHHV